MMVRSVGDFPLAGIRSDLAGIGWPAVSTGSTAVLAALIHQLDHTQWLPEQEIARRQRDQLGLLARHCVDHSPFFRRRLLRAGLTPDDLVRPDGLRRLPVMSRREIQTTPAADFYCAEVPPGHAPFMEGRTSGSTGEPLVVRRTAVNRLDWLALTMREHLWHRRDFGGRLCSIRANVAETARLEDWGPPASLLFRTGPSLILPISGSVESLAAMLVEFRPDNLLVYPSTLDALVAHFRGTPLPLPGLRQIRTIGETLSPTLREEAAAAFGATVIDSYSSQEVGYIASECPDSGLYHVNSETVLVEILDGQGEPCREGETGRVVMTDLHNFATPLVRYDIGDYAEVGGPCACGRGLPTLRKILGRQRNLVLMPDGTRHWPLVGAWSYRDIAPISQYQLVQHNRELIEVRLVVETPLTREQEDGLAAVIRGRLGHPFALRFAYLAGRLPTGPGGKFEEFICRAE